MKFCTCHQNSEHTCAEEHIASVVQLPHDGELLGLTVTSTGFNDMISIGTSKILATVWTNFVLIPNQTRFF